MLEAPPFDRDLGMLYYATSICPSGGIIKSAPEDFIVEEVLKDGTVVAIDGFNPMPRMGNWTWIHVVKKNVDTLKLVLRVARAFNISPRDVGIGGIKDTRALASHIISVRGSVSDLPQIPGVEFKSMWSMDRPISPSEIFGNRFTITICNILRLECAAKALESIGRTILPNFYGYQRFGTIRPISHRLGIALLRKDAESFFHWMFCKTFPRESEKAKRARELACRGEIAKAYEAFPRKFLEERALLRKLLRGSDLWNAIMGVPRSILRIYVEASQSYLFNLFLSRRMELGPLDKPIDGDLMEINGQISYYIEGLGGELVLPVIGAGVRMPRGKIGDLLLRVLKEVGIEPSAFLKMPRDLRAYGSYRKAVLHIYDLSYSLEGSSSRLRFILPKGSYATVILREVIKPEDPAAHGF